MPPMDHTRAIVHSCGTFLMCPPASGVEGLSESEHVQSHDGIGSATAVLSLDGSLLAFAGTENSHVESQAYCEKFGPERTRGPAACRAYLFRTREQPTCSRGSFTLHLHHSGWRGRT